MSHTSDTVYRFKHSVTLNRQQEDYARTLLQSGIFGRSVSELLRRCFDTYIEELLREKSMLPAEGVAMPLRPLYKEGANAASNR